ncbi:ABC transporter substrate-binding protein [Kitasatospora herbaricolor]|uniref:ABC transporter substrate-binding protein n=1 Tax=Kitasatospora herbaricolor TaxID=68217 RepID=UPI00198D86CB|nr:ABC transporter substrate-binding protein [Kitasatospora herbaricolor]MDQ0306229.1 polar amino acid transport system substrate-binding protein [Kitasatospora herbaricolor]GGV41684.1 ABC transporter substrate-binding protein [Kitasatospora herbaricolor]
MLTTLRIRRAAAVALAACGALLLTACSGDAGSSGGDAAAAPKALTVAGVEIEQDAALHAALPEAVRKAGKVRVATDVPYPPFEMYIAEGKTEMTGLDHDLGQALGAKLGVKFEFTAQKFDGIVPAIQAGKYDAAISAITDNKEREKVVDFVDYSASGTGILVEAGNPHGIVTLNDLCGRPVAVQTGTNQQKLLDKQQDACKAAGRPAVDVQAFPKDSDAQLALRSAKVVADVLTKPAAGWTAKTADGGKAFQVVDDPAAPGGYNASPNGVAVSKNLPELTDAVQKALQQLIDDGSIAKIYDKYGVASIAVKQATKNGAVD